jgi:hypothetical protein
MHRYDPERAPKPREWLALDEMDRIELVEKHHRKAGVDLPDSRSHAAIHAVVENQLAMTHEPVVRALNRLMAGGLSRHDAVHAIGSVLAEHLFKLLNDKDPSADAMATYDAAIERLTVESWHEDYL